MRSQSTTSYVDATCRHCGILFQARTYDVRRGFGTSCSRNCQYASLTRPIEERFWEKVDRSGPIPRHRPELGNCWVWTAGRDTFGYGDFTLDGRRRKSHVVAYIWTYGELPADRPCVLHACDGGIIGCVRPSHLFAGTKQINNVDRDDKGRTAIGARNGRARLNEDQVREIRRRWAVGGIRQKALAHEYGVALVTIEEVIRRKKWRHVE